MLQTSSIVRYPAIVAFRSFAESLALEQVHEQAYRDLGFQLIDVPAGPLAEQTALIQQIRRELVLRERR
jgi:predicted ATPase